MSALVELHKKLVDEWAKDAKRDIANVEKILADIKTATIQPGAEQGLAPKALCTIHRDIYEISALSAALREDLAAFDDAIEQVMAYYASATSDSDHKNLMIGLNLMYLVASNRLSEFHMLLEQVSQDVQRANPYIAVPVTIEQSLMEGAYNKVALSEKNIPSPYFVPFFRVMTDAIRAEIAACMSKSFKKVPVTDAVSLLIFKSPAEVVAYAKLRGWTLEANNSIIVLNASMQVDGQAKSALDPTRIAKQTIFYAKQLEMIV
ncbi:rpn-12 [Pristionchus pacificus]|uniref:Rpn-12 n=1 Tax=Pristionchus pacificus TaxID=54126 RepID=A0A2A6CW93_PRIPA|nr:rpn-12 [Pristionchus pacificus]|eukprot:PDM82317.1 rpn-12 [Pristionchus pacificus]